MKIKARIHSRRLCFQYIYMWLSDSSNISIENVDYLKNDIYAENEITDFDDDYISQIISNFNNNHEAYSSELKELVNAHTTGFWRDDMDNIKKTAFLLWYMESKIIKTLKLVIINEIVELCKLFGNDQAAKLVNGIIHKILPEWENDSLSTKKSEPR